MSGRIISGKLEWNSPMCHYLAAQPGNVLLKCQCSKQGVLVLWGVPVIYVTILIDLMCFQLSKVWKLCICAFAFVQILIKTLYCVENSQLSLT